jgi:hypothetical protein
MPIFDKPPKSGTSEAYHPPYVLLLIAALVICFRIYLIQAIGSNQSHDAQWQLAYWPLWVIDFPISVAYFIFPIPFGEQVVGTLWWCSLPFLVAKWRKKRNLQAPSTTNKGNL